MTDQVLASELLAFASGRLGRGRLQVSAISTAAAREEHGLRQCWRLPSGHTRLPWLPFCHGCAHGDPASLTLRGSERALQRDLKRI